MCQTPSRLLAALTTFFCPLVLCAIAWAQTSLYPSTADWRSAPAEITSALAAADVTGDGYLDLVSGNFNQPLRLYCSIAAGVTSPAWTSNITARTFAVAFADIDGDAAPDLVCGTDGQILVFYNVGFGLNGAPPFGGSPDWSSSRSHATTSIAVGDVDNDGDIDLVCGNFNQPDVLYINNGSALDTVPVWSSDSAWATNQTALADIDGDNTLDLVCGIDGVNVAYLNRGGPAVFEPAPDWRSDSSYVTTSIALGDLDGDGDVDLVCGNADRENTIYLNEGTLGTNPLYWGDTADATRSIVLGDVDHDGDLDIVAGNRSQANRLYLNAGFGGIVTLSWSGPAEETAAVLLADMDGDGSLDIAAGNYSESNTIFLNLSGPFERSPAWQSNPFNQSLTVAVGEIGGNASPDVVFGNNGANTLYLNNGTIFETDPAPWNPAPDGNTSGIVLLDVDGDGDLDVACGNWVPEGAPQTLYINRGGILDASSSWPGTVSAITRGIASADINGDRLPDLIFGNENQVNALYLNTGAAPWFAQVPSWLSADSRPTTDIAAGDMDGDGYGDVVCANLADRNAFFHSNAGSLSTDPDWLSDTVGNAEAVALGDLDGDGDLDIVFGNDGQPNTMLSYAGDQPSFVQTWASETARRTRSIALGDVDGDGDLDLVCGNRDEANSVYENRGGTLSSLPVWNSLPQYTTEDIVLCDIDSDGDLDLVCANIGSNTAYTGVRNPPFRGDPAVPVNQLPNNPPVISSLTLEEAGTNRMTIRFKLFDAESDPVWLIAEYHYTGDATWFACVGPGFSGLAGRFATAPAGRVDSLEWDISLLPFDRRPAEIRLKLVELPRRSGSLQHLPSFVKSAGVIEPERPQLATVPDKLTFPGVTQGDTVSLDISIANHGNSNLIIDSITPPSGEMTIVPAQSITVPPGGSLPITVNLHPLNESFLSGTLDIISNDPFRPLVSLDVTADIHELAVATRLLAVNDTIPLGEAVTVIIEPLPDVRIEGGTLFHRPEGTAGFDSTRLGRSGNDFIAVIPGSSVREGTIEYYVRVENIPAVRTDPPDAPVSVFTRAVEQPVSITVSSRPTFESDYIAGREIDIEVFLQPGTEFVSGRLYFREGAALDYRNTALEWNNISASAVIPDSIVGIRGIEYAVEVQTRTTTLSFPAPDPLSSPASIPVLVENTTEPQMRAGERYRLFSIPLRMRGSILGSIADELGGPDAARWRLFAFENPEQRYRELPDDSVTQFTLGQAYWFIARGEHRIGTGPDYGVTARTDLPFEITLRPGYNLIGLPYTFPVAWSSMLIDTLAALTAEGVLIESPVSWNPDKRRYEPNASTFEPWSGYWIKNIDTSDVRLIIPPIEATSVSIIRSGSEASSGWSITIQASLPEAGSTPAVLGVRSGASPLWDRFDHSMPPNAPGRNLAVYFPHTSWSIHPDDYTHDFRGDVEAINPSGAVTDKTGLTAGTAGYVWIFDVCKPFPGSAAGDEVVLEFAGIENVSSTFSIYLVDRILGNVIDLRKENVYSYIHRSGTGVPDENDARFELIAGSDEYIGTRGFPDDPAETKLHGGYPNPFNPFSTIRYDIAVPCRVRIGIYDVHGALIKIIADKQHDAGRYEVQWDGTDMNGVLTASGVYFCRLVANSVIHTRKIILLK